jgi:hypothetical protein
MEKVTFNGWSCLRLANREVELVITRDVGPRVIRFGYIGGKNLFREMPGQQGKTGEAEWQIRGGHRFWIAPEAQPWSYELDNVSYESAEMIAGGVRVRQAAGPITGLVKQMEITLASDSNTVTVTHTLTNAGGEAIECAPWALSAMNLNGQAVIPLPAKIAHTGRLTHNQTWSLWGYTDFADPRWTLGSRYLFFRQDPSRSANKLGIAHREKWVAYQLDGFLFVKSFEHFDGQKYPDDGCSFETFSNEDILELESLGPLVVLKPGGSTRHVETWKLFKDVPLCKTEADADTFIRPLV